MKNLLFILGLFICVGLQAQNVIISTGSLTKSTVDSIQVNTVANGVTLNSTDGIRLTGTATQWDDIFFPFSTGQAANASYPTFNSDSMTWNFVIDTVGITKCEKYFICQFPHSEYFDTIFPHVHFKYTTAQGTPTFVMKYKWFNIGSTTISSWNWLRMGTIETAGVNCQHNLVHDGIGILAGGKTFSSILVCQLYLYTTSGVTKTCDAYQFDIHIKKKSFGSKTEYAD